MNIHQDAKTSRTESESQIMEKFLLQIVVKQKHFISLNLKTSSDQLIFIFFNNISKMIAL